MSYDVIVTVAARGFEMAGIAVMVGGTLLAAARAAAHRSYHELRRGIALSILLGLELLVAADIIATVVIGPALESVVALGIIVLIRTFLSFSLEMEATGRWPWARSDSAARSPEH
jgi:uncharacterized membrane protein